MHSGGSATSRFTFSPGNAKAMTARMGVISLPSALLSHAHRSSVAFVPSFERCFVAALPALDALDMFRNPLDPKGGKEQGTQRRFRHPYQTERSLPETSRSGQGAHSLTRERSDSGYEGKHPAAGHAGLAGPDSPFGAASGEGPEAQRIRHGASLPALGATSPCGAVRRRGMPRAAHPGVTPARLRRPRCREAPAASGCPACCRCCRCGFWPCGWKW